MHDQLPTAQQQRLLRRMTPWRPDLGSCLQKLSGPIGEGLRVAPLLIPSVRTAPRWGMRFWWRMPVRCRLSIGANRQNDPFDARNRSTRSLVKFLIIRPLTTDHENGSAGIRHLRSIWRLFSRELVSYSMR